MKKQILCLLLTVCLMLNMLPDMAFADAAFTITYNVNGGNGSMAEDTTTEGMITLPDCTFTPPEGKQFQCWAIGSAEGTQSEVGETYTFTNDTTVYAVWEDAFSTTTTTLLDDTVGTADNQTLTTSGGTGVEGITSWADLKDAISKASTTENTLITIGADFSTTSESWDPISINKDVHIILQSAADHNFTIIRADGSQGPFFFMINGNSSLTLQNITLDGGGENLSKTPDSSLIYVSNTEDTASLILDSGAVLQNNHIQSSNGGAISASSAIITMNSGSLIQNNSTNTTGGGICLLNATLTMNGGSIQNNTVTGSGRSGGGVVVLSNVGSSVFNMNGGSITGNTAYIGGGVDVSGGDSSVFNLSGGTITGNIATGYYGGGVNLSGPSFRTGGTELNAALMNIKGNPVISGNKSGAVESSRVASDLYMQGINTGVTTKAATLQKSGDFVAGASVGINLPYGYNPNVLISDGTNTVTEGDASHFFSNNATKTIKYDSVLSALVVGDSGVSAPVITTASLPEGTVDKAYSQTLAATGTTPITWSVKSGNLPAGLILNSATGVISGTPTAAVTSTFTVRALDGTYQIATRELSITIAKAAATVWDGTSAQYFDGGTGISTDPYQIRTAEQLALLTDVFNGKIDKKVVAAQAVQPYTTLQAAYYKLTADIKLNDTTNVAQWETTAPGNTWRAIGGLDYFKGVFDGDNHTVSGLYNNRTDGYSVGLFGINQGKIINVYVKDGYVNGLSAVGSIATENQGTIDNCHNTVNVATQYSAGGIVGNNNTGIIKNCTNAGEVTNREGQFGGTYAGGIAAISGGVGSRIENCTNSGKIVGVYMIGGIVGRVEKSTVRNCTNTGTVTGTKTGNVTGTDSIGGISGAEYANTIINTCINTGIIRGDNKVGGIVGWKLDGTIESVFSPKGATIGATTDVGLPNLYYIGHIIGGIIVGSYSGSSDSYGGITVSPASTTVAQGATNTFSAQGMKTGDTVEWSIGDGISGTTIDTNGMLTVAVDETATTLAVIAVVKTNGVVTGFGTATVTITKTPTVTGITVTPASATVKRSKTQQFSVVVNGENSPDQTVTWSIVETVQTGTSIDENGLLTVAVGETANSLTIKATSTADNTKSGTASVTVTETTPSGTVWNGTSAQYFDGGEGTADKPYLIRTAEQLTLLAGVINQVTYSANDTSTNYGSGNREVVAGQGMQTYEYLKSASYKLTLDIMLNDTGNVANWATAAPSNTWKVIGKYPDYFKGVFDGNGHTISGLFYSNSNAYSVGLFSSNYGTIENLNLKDGYINAKGQAGSIVGDENYGIIDNCHNSISVSADYKVGGLVYHNNSGTIKNSSNAGTVTQRAEEAYGSNFAGGIASYNGYGGTIKNCTNTGDVTGTYMVGGIAGGIHSSSVSDCINMGKVTGTKAVGGISGCSDSLCEMNNCINTGIISGTNWVGGIFGVKAGGSMANVFSPKWATIGATADIGTADSYHGYIIGNGSGDTSGGFDHYGSITISPASKTVPKSGKVTFMVNGTKSGDTVEWSVTGGINGTIITSGGELTVANNETTAKLTVTAIVKTNGVVTGAGTANVTIGTPPTVTGITITPISTEIVKGKTEQFVAAVAGENGPSQKVEWEVTGGISGTAISATGLLTVAENETATELTVKATSVEDNTKSANVKVTVTATTATGKVWDGTSALYFDGGKGTADEPYLIRTAEQLTLLAGVINQLTYGANNTSTSYGSGNREVVAGQGMQTYDYLQKAYYKLTADIILNDTSNVANWATVAPNNSWKMIGYNGNYFNGVFDGGGFNINGLYFSNPSVTIMGLFYTNNGTIKNLNLKNGYIDVQSQAASIVGFYNYGMIDNCHNSITVSANMSAAGLVYYNYGGTIQNSSNAGTITQRYPATSGNYQTGGIASYTGGEGSIINCTNTGIVNGTFKLGGIVGNHGSSTISNCTNTGIVTGDSAVGGIVGYNPYGSIMNCINTGKISGDTLVGGIVGWQNGGSATNANCINTGIISGTSSVGGIVGWQNAGTSTNAFSPQWATVGAVADIGTAEKYYGYIIGQENSNTTGSSNHYGSITISPASATVEKGGTKTFTVNGTQSGNTVEWSVAGGINGTTITTNGLLTVANNETATKLTVTVIVKANGIVTGAGTANVTIGTPVIVTGVTISPNSAEVKKSKTQQFSATVTSNGATTVTWSVSGGTNSTISENGLLLVGGLETASTLTVKAASTADSSVFATVMVTVAPAPKLYTVTFNSQGGSVVPAVSGIEEGKNITLPAAPTQSGYRFDGWYTQTNGGGTSFTAQTTVNASITVYAKWTKIITLFGKVYGTNGTTVVSGVAITLSPVSGTTTQTTGEDGSFRFIGIPEEMYTVTAEYPDSTVVSVNVSSNYENVVIVKPIPSIEITTQPADATIVLGMNGSSAVFNVFSQRTPYIADKVGYQWYWLKGTTPNGGNGITPDQRVTNIEGTPVSGSQLTLNSSNGNIPTRGTYRLYAIAYDANGEAENVYSRIITLKVIGTNTLEGVVKKENGTLIEGASVKLEAIGTPTHTPYTSSTNPQTTGVDGAYKFETVPDGSYKLVISLPGGGVIEYKNVNLPKTDPTNPVDIEIIVPDKASIKINGQPQDVTVKNGTTATLTVNATSADGTAVTYQWFKNSKNANTGGTEIPGATEKEYTPLTSIKGTFYYYCVISSTSLEAVTTRNAKVTVVAYGVISGMVKTREGTLLANATVELINTDTPVKTGVTISANPQITKADGKYGFTEVLDGNYKLKITLPDGTRFEEPLFVPGTNEEVIITQPEQPIIKITEQPKSMTVVLSDTAELSVTASSSSGETVLYQWYKNSENSTIGGTAISGATKATYRASTTTKGISYYYCVVNATGAKAVTSSIAKLTVRNTSVDNLMTLEGIVLDDTTPGNPVQGAIVTLSPKAGTSINPQTTGADGHYKFENLPDGKYTVTVTLPGGGTVTEKIITDDGNISPTQPSNIEVPVTNSITITKQPTDILITTDMTATFDTKATASKAGVTYQWYKSATNINSGGTKLIGKTDATLQLDQQSEGSSYYYCVISSTAATDVATHPAKLIVTKAAVEKGDIGGSIVDDENGKSVEGASVKLMKNGTDGDQFGSTMITGADGKFAFTDIPYGSYSLVAQKGTQTITRQISIKSNITTENLTLLSGGKLTRVEVAQGAPSTAVENLEDIFTTDDAAIAQQTGATVEIKLVVEQKDSPEDKLQVEAILTDNQQVGLYLDAKLVKTISGTVSEDATEYIQPSAGQMLRIVLDLPESLQGLNGYKIIRSHTENGVTSIRIIENPVYDGTLQTLTFEADAFSTYAVVYTQELSYSVTVVDSQNQTTSGTGLYHENDTVTINAGNRSGYTFNGWTSTDGVSFAAAGSAATTFTMPAKNVTVNANWKVNAGGEYPGGINTGGGNNPGGGIQEPDYSVTIHNSQAGASSGTGRYKEKDAVTISAGSRNGYTFTGWTTMDGVTFGDPKSTNTNFIMPAKNVTVSANWKVNEATGDTKEPDYRVTVLNSQAGTSSGSGLYHAKDIVTISAGSRKGYTFTGWTTTEGVSLTASNSATTTFIMITKNVKVTANWKTTKGGSGTDSGNGSGTDSGNGSGTDSGNGSGTDSGNGSGSGSGNGSGTDSGNGSGSGSGNGSGTDSGNGNGSDSGNGSGSDSGNRSGTDTENGSGTNTGNEGSTDSGNESNSSTEESDNDAGSGQITSADLSEAKDNALKNLADQWEKATNTLTATLTSEQLQVASGKIELIYNEALEKIQNAETQDIVDTVYDKAISDINTVLADQVVDVAGENTGDNTGENKDTGKPFNLFSALLMLVAILAAGMLLLQRGKKWDAILAVVFAAAALVLFLFTSGFSGFVLVNLWTFVSVVFAAWPVGLLWHAMRKNSDGMQ